MARLDLTTSAPGALSGLLQEIRGGGDALVIGPSEAARAVLDGAAAALAGEARVVRIAAGPGALSLSGLMAQVVGDADLAAQDDAVLEQGYRCLAVPDAPEQRIVLLIAEAGLLQLPALRFVQHIARNAPALLLVLAGGPELDRLLDGPDFAALRLRLPKGAEPPAARERVSTISKRRSGAPAWAGAGLGLAASVALAAWALRGPTHRAETPTPLVAEQVQVTPPAPVEPQIARPEPAKAEPPPVRQAMATPPPPAPPPAPQAAEPERLPLPTRPRRQAEARPKEPPAHAAPRRTHVARAAPRGPETGARDWDEEDAPLAAYGSEPPPYWRRSSGENWGPAPPREGPYIGTFAADSYGMRTFRYEGGWR